MYNGSVKLSAVIPFHNEEACAENVILETAEVLKGLNQSFEILAVNDGSSDRTRDILSALCPSIPELRVFSARKKGGQSSAVYFGLQKAKGEILLTMDGDGQNDPHDFPAMITLLNDADMVVGVRRKRKDRWIKRISSKIANSFRRLVLRDPFHDVGCAMRVMSNRVSRNLPYFTSLHRFAPILACRMGFTVKEIPVNHRARLGGKTKYGTWDRLIVGLSDLYGVRWLTRRIQAYEIREHIDEENA